VAKAALRNIKQGMTLTVAILEFVAGGGLCDVPWNKISPSLRTEGACMLDSVVMNLANSGIRPIACLDERFAKCGISDSKRFSRIDSATNWCEQWLKLASRADATVLIAPETDQVLLQLCKWLREQGICVLASDATFLSATSDKLATAHFLTKTNCGHPETTTLREWSTKSSSRLAQFGSDHGWVIKSRDGAGCDSVHRVRNISDLDELLAKKPDLDAWIVQRWIDGIAGSVSVLCGPNDQVVLPACLQRIDSRGEVRYEGGAAPWTGVNRVSMTDFAKRTLAAMPGNSLGWIGIDWVFTSDKELIPIEINPRLTTSIVGLQHLFSNSLAEAMIRVALGDSCCLSPSLGTAEWSTFPEFELRTTRLS
jgi:tyramine---L-glutamate ligase